MQHLSPVMPGENLFAKASASEQALPHGKARALRALGFA
jgi:hypothetical protein